MRAIGDYALEVTTALPLLLAVADEVSARLSLVLAALG